jgi:hypothetical protein
MKQLTFGLVLLAFTLEAGPPAKVAASSSADANKPVAMDLATNKAEVATPPAAKTADSKPSNSYDPTKYRGEGVFDAEGKLQFVVEHASQTHSKDDFVMVRVTGIKTRGAKEKGRIRIAVWEREDNYAKEGVAPFRASSFDAKFAINGEMLFKIGLPKGKSYSFFAHFDKENRGYIHKIMLIPVDPYVFTNAATQGRGPGLTRDGLSAPKFMNTLVRFETSGQEILMSF